MEKKINSAEQERTDLCLSINAWQKSEKGNSCFCILSDSDTMSSVIAGNGKDLVTALCMAMDTTPDLENILKTALITYGLMKAVK